MFMLYGQVLLMKQQLENEGIPAITYYEEGKNYEMGESLPFWAVMVAGGPFVGLRLCDEEQFFGFFNHVKANPDKFKGNLLMKKDFDL